MNAATPILVTAVLSFCVVVGCGRREGTQSSTGKTPSGPVVPAARPKLNSAAERSRSVAEQEGAKPVAKPPASSTVEQEEAKVAPVPSAPGTGALPQDWDIKSALQEAQPAGKTIYTGGVRVEAPDGTVIQSDRAEVFVNEKGVLVTVIYAGSVRMQRPDGSMIKAAQLEMDYSSAGRVMSMKAPEIEIVQPKK